MLDMKSYYFVIIQRKLYHIILRFKGALATILTKKIICFGNW